MMIARLVSVAALVLVAASMAAPAARADWRHERNADWRYDPRAEWRYDPRADWRYDEEWRWRHHPPHYHPYPREVMVIYPPPPAYMPGPRVVYVEPAPVQAVPTSPPYTDPQGRYCREYQTTVAIGGQPQPGYGTACLMPDGQWRVVR